MRQDGHGDGGSMTGWGEDAEEDWRFCGSLGQKGMKSRGATPPTAEGETGGNLALLRT